MAENRADDWLRQAENDWLFAENACKSGFYSQACFIAQQSAEKALKALLFAQGAKAVMTHSLIALCKELDINGRLRAISGVLDQYYLSGRYPDALPGGAPFESFTETQAQQAVDDARALLDFVNEAFPDG